jgi:carbon monoxide dehydrogenase subunit G
MKIDLQGEFDVSSSVSDSYAFLTDPKRFAPLLPMFKELSNVQDDRFRVVLDVGMPQVRGRAEADVTFVERVPGQLAVLRSKVRHSLGMGDTDMRFELAPAAGGTRVTWRCDTMVRGTLASLASGILAPLARKNVDAMIQSVQQELGAPAAQAFAAPTAAPAGAKPGFWQRIALWFRSLRGSGRHA